MVRPEPEIELSGREVNLRNYLEWNVFGLVNHSPWRTCTVPEIVLGWPGQSQKLSSQVEKLTCVTVPGVECVWFGKPLPMAYLYLR